MPPRENRFTNPWIGAAILFLFMLYAVFTNILPRAPAPADPGVLTIRMPDLGQADCFLLTQGDSCMLIDCGEADHAPRILETLEDLGITSLDILVLTHPHSDHTGAASAILDAIEVDTVLVCAAAADLYNLPQAVPQAAGDRFTLGDAVVEVLSPAPDAVTDDLNDASLVLRVTFAGQSALFMGDAGSDVELALLREGQDLSAAILKAAHHGSADACTEAFLSAVSPSYILLSVREDEPADLPNTDTLARLEATGAQLLRTDRQGAVSITIAADGAITYAAERGET